MELRDEQGHLHGIVLQDGRVEVKCRSRFCGAGAGVVVFHRFNIDNGAVETRRYRDPANEGNTKKEDS